MDFEVIGEIIVAETFAQGHGIRSLAKLTEKYGGKNWRKRKGFVSVRVLETGEIQPC
jgi:hypothetical protein